MFGNTYVCESTFSMMKQVKSENRNWRQTKQWMIFSDLLYH